MSQLQLDLNDNSILVNYQELALRTASPRLPLQHALVGLAGESMELLDILKKKDIYGKPIDVIHFKEELGDLFWYNALLFKTLNIKLDLTEIKGTNHNWAEDTAHLWMTLTVLLKLSSEQLMKHLAGLNPTKTEASAVLGLSGSLVNMTDMSLVDILHRNINKLATRYPEGYSDHLAVNRDLESEYEALNTGG